MLRVKKKPWKKKYNKTHQPRNRHIYDKARWRGPNGLRLLRLKTSPFCSCGAAGAMVDHIIPINNGGDPWAYENTQTMCKPCHDIKRSKERKLYETNNY